MMRRKKMKMGIARRSRIAIRLAALASAGAVFMVAPSAPRAQAAQDPYCNLYNLGEICKKQEDCAWFIFYKKCTTQYWRLIDMGGPGDDPTDPPELDK